MLQSCHGLMKWAIAIAVSLGMITIGGSFLSGAEPDPDALDALFVHPAADGLIVREVVPGGQGESLGLRPGDIITSYASHPLPSVAILQGLIAQSLPAPLTIEVVRGEKKMNVNVGAGKLGCYLAVAKAGVDTTLRAKRIVPLPPETPFAMDLSGLGTHPRETWQAFHFGDGDPHVGYEHYRLAIEKDHLVATYDYAFDSHQFPIIADYEQSTFLLPPGTSILHGLPAIQQATFDGDDVHDHGMGFSGVDASGNPTWSSDEALFKDGAWSSVHKTHPRPPVPQAGALQMHLGSFLAHTPGACVHFSSWQKDQSVVLALKVEREENLDLPDKSHHHAWVVRLYTTDGPDMISWFGDDGTPLKTDFGKNYGGAYSILTTRDQALADITPSIRVRKEDQSLIPLSALAPASASGSTPAAGKGGF